ncbi:MAG: hypothetical protein KHY46_11455, partial [Clostridiales bacterium]|nr:hypothetical protein [Clostridiales bacterium]
SEFSQIQRSKPDLLFLECSGFYILFNLQFSRFFVVVISAATFISYHSRFCLSTTFFILFSLFSSAGSNDNTAANVCQLFFIIFWKRSGERGI